MPGVDGIEAATRIAGARVAPVVMITAFSQRELVERARVAGAMAYLVKPFQKKDLLPAIEMAVSRFAEISRLEAEVLDLTGAYRDPQDRREGEGRAAGVRDDGAGGVPLAAEAIDEPADDHAGPG